MSYIKGNFKKYIFKSDNNFVVGLFKIRDVSSDLELNSKTIIFTGYFTELNDFDLYEFQGKLVNHDKYIDIQQKTIDNIQNKNKVMTSSCCPELVQKDWQERLAVLCQRIVAAG